MIGKILILLGMLVLAVTPAHACRCFAADTPKERAEYTHAIADNAHAIVLGTFNEGTETGHRLFKVDEVIAGSEQKMYKFAPSSSRRAGEKLIYSGSCDQIGLESGKRTILFVDVKTATTPSIVQTAAPPLS